MTEKIIAYKGTDKNMKCRGFQYEMGREFVHRGPVEACRSGFHACEMMFDVLNYYPPSTSRFFEVEMWGEVFRQGPDSKIVSPSIKFTTEISVSDFINRAVGQAVRVSKNTSKKFGYRSVATNTGYRSVATNTGNQSVATSTGDQSVATNTGNRSVATNTGYRSVATSTGDQSVATNTGYRSVATSTGYRSVATNTGYRSVATASGACSTAIASGVEGKVMAEMDGCSLFANEIDWDSENGKNRIISNASGITGRGKIKAGVWYICKSGKLVETT